MASVRRAGGEVYAITSEPQSLARDAQEDWQTDLEHVGDPHHEILETCRARGLLTLFVADWGNDLVSHDWVSHPKGYYQPGVLAMTQGGRVLYRWRSRPNRQNIGGAIARPTPEHVWRNLEPELDSTSTDDVPLDEAPELDAKAAPWPLFVTLLLANGWFLRAKTFAHSPGAGDERARIRRAMRRIPLFIVFWVLLAIVLPGWAVATAALVWLAWITPSVVTVHKRFQNVGEDAAEAHPGG